MPSEITVTVNGAPVDVPSGATVAVAMVIAGTSMPNVSER